MKKLPEQILEESAKLMRKKRADYSSEGTVHENFERSEIVISWFKNDIDKVYATLITVKLARLAVLLSQDEEPQNESIRDSFKDLINYSALWGSKRS